MDIVEILNKCNTIGEVAKEIKGYSNGITNKIVKEYIIEYGYEYKFLYSSDEKYNLNPKKCKNCDSIISFDKRYNDFCSGSCAVSYNNKKRGPRSEKTKKKISSTLKGKKYNRRKNELKKYTRQCVQCGEIFIVKRLDNGRLSKSKTCGEKCLSNLRSEITKTIMKQKVLDGTHKGWQSRNIVSYPEEFFMKVLDENNIKYEHNFMIKKRDLGIDDDSCYFLDFFIKDKKIDLEIDGKQHKYEDRQESDFTRDLILGKNDIKVYRIQWKSINKTEGKDYISNEIKKFFDFLRSSSSVG